MKASHMIGVLPRQLRRRHCPTQWVASKPDERFRAALSYAQASDEPVSRIGVRSPRPRSRRLARSATFGRSAHAREGEHQEPLNEQDQDRRDLVPDAPPLEVAVLIVGVL